MDDNDLFIEDDFVDDDIDVVVEEGEQSEEPQEKTLEELLPTDCILISMEGGQLDPLVSVRGRYRDDLGEAVAFLRSAIAKVQYFKYVQERT